jgi:prepilin peptidase CpaA
VVTAAAVTDARLRRIPNLLTLPAIVVGLLLWVPDSTPRQFGGVLALTAAVFVIGLCLYVVGAFGGGDGKLLSAIAAIGGPGFFAEFLVWTSIIGVAVSLVVLAATRSLLPFAGRVARATINVLRFGEPLESVTEGKGHTIPYGVIAAGGAVLATIANLEGLHFF